MHLRHHRLKLADAAGERSGREQRELTAPRDEALAFVSGNPVPVRGVGDYHIDASIRQVRRCRADDLARPSGIAEGIDDQTGLDVAEIRTQPREPCRYDYRPADDRPSMTHDEAVEIRATGRVDG